IADAGEGIRDIGDAGAGEERAVGTEGHAANAADVGAKSRVVLVEHARVEVAYGLARREVPLLHHPLEIGRDEMLAVGMEGDVVDVAGVAFESADELAVAGRPEPYEVIIAARRDEAAVGAHHHGARPPLVRLDLPARRGALGVERPGDELAVVAGGEAELLLRREREAALPALVPGEQRLLAAGQLEAHDAVLLRRREDELALGVEAAAEQRGGVLQ